MKIQRGRCFVLLSCSYEDSKRKMLCVVQKIVEEINGCLYS